MARDAGPPAPDAEDRALVARALDGDESAFAAIVERHAPRCLAIARSIVRDEQDALDAVQDTFLSAWRGLDRYRGDAPLSAWLARIAANHALMRLRRRRRKPEVSLEPRGPAFDEMGRHARPVVDVSPLAERVALDRELGRRIRAEIDALPEKYRVVVVMADLGGASMREIADALGLSVGGVKTRLHRARLAIREGLADYLAGRE